MPGQWSEGSWVRDRGVCDRPSPLWCPARCRTSRPPQGASLRAPCRGSPEPAGHVRDQAFRQSHVDGSKNRHLASNTWHGVPWFIGPAGGKRLSSDERDLVHASREPYTARNFIHLRDSYANIVPCLRYLLVRTDHCAPLSMHLTPSSAIVDSFLIASKDIPPARHFRHALRCSLPSWPHEYSVDVMVSRSEAKDSAVGFRCGVVYEDGAGWWCRVRRCPCLNTGSVERIAAAILADSGSKLFELSFTFGGFGRATARGAHGKRTRRNEAGCSTHGTGHIEVGPHLGHVRSNTFKHFVRHRNGPHVLMTPVRRLEPSFAKEDPFMLIF